MILLAVDVEGLVPGDDRSAAGERPTTRRFEASIAGEVVRSRVVPGCERLRRGAAVPADERRIGSALALRPPDRAGENEGAAEQTKLP